MSDADAEAQVWDAYNLLLLGPDVDRIRKLLVRYELAKTALEVPGDIVECGVFKGAGCLYWLKLLHVLEPGSLRRVIGFDTFTEFAPSQRDDERAAIADFVASSGFEGTTPERVQEYAEAAGLGERLELVAGDVTTTAAEFASRNPGLRISLLHLDLDAFEGTRAALAALYPRVSRGGLVVFDEYAIPEWGESDAADEFMAQHPEVRLQPVPLSAKPTAYFVKP